MRHRTEPLHSAPMLTSLLAIAIAALTPQDPAGTPGDLTELASRVDAAHHPKGPVAPITALRANLEMHALDTDAKETGQVDLAVRLLQWRRPDRDREQTLIHYEVLEAGSPIVRGRDRNGPWQLVQGEAKDLRGAEFGRDLEACQKHTNLARQLLRFLDPGAVLRSLQKPVPVIDEVLAIDRETKVACRRAEGRLPSFPLLRQNGDDAPVRLRVWVGKENGRLVAAEAAPLVGDEPDETRAERVLLLDLHERDDLLVPRKLEHLFRTQEGRLRLQSRVVFTSLSLRPELRAEDFDRPKS